MISHEFRFFSLIRLFTIICTNKLRQDLEVTTIKNNCLALAVRSWLFVGLISVIFNDILIYAIV
jgi:hypothetical protein